MYATTKLADNNLLLFGPQIPRLVPAYVADLRRTILEEPELEFLVRIVRDLPLLWTSTIQPSCSRLGRLPGAEKQLQQLGALLESETGEIAPRRQACNMLLVPLTVIAQIVEYVRLGRPGRVEGFCVGFLAATAVASARNRAELERWTATAIRLAVCIGAVVDLDQHERSHGHPESPECCSTWSVRWTSTLEKKQLEKTLASISEAYISCITDVDRVTLTIPEGQFASFARQLADGGLSAQPIGLCGRYHTASSDRKEVVQQLKLLCRQDERFQFPAVEHLSLPPRSTWDTKVITDDLLHDVALDCTLVHVCRWYETVQAALDAWDDQPVNVISVGNSSGTIPRSFKLATAAYEPLTLNDCTKSQPTAESLVTGNGKVNSTINSTLSSIQPTPESTRSLGPEATAMPIAVIGMACRYAQAESLEQFWSLITSGRNAATPVPADRFGSEDLWRTPKGPFYGNFLQDADTFDHRFFQMSAREAASMDPQQRLLLQVTYEAMESAGYAEGSESPKRPVGCYVGSGYVEYEDNVASENATAYSATGTIRAFISGRVSHHFGWTGPSVVFDTACSSSAVAIHHACKALQTSDCSVAVAGGVNIITSATFYQNLAAASFLNSTGASKAFDAQANGYCRGEGGGMLVLKPLSQAIVDNDRILGTIVGSGVNQNSNCSPITVPDSGSQSDLYLQVLAGAGVSPSEVTYVEAHGTGTPVGDPIECASIRTALGSPHRSQEVVIGSVKDVVGHTEAASGVAGIIKTLLMMQQGTIPKQPNFAQLNPKIPALEPDKMAIASQSRPWHDSTRRLALVNNYGAAGSNAAIVLQGYCADSTARDTTGPLLQDDTVEYPIFLSAKTPESLCAYSAALRAFLDRRPSITLGDVAYNLARKQNRALEYATSWTASNLSALRQDLEAITAGTRPVTQRSAVMQKKKAAAAELVWPVPVVLCFGGQTGRSIHLSEEVFQSSALLQTHLGRCDEACQVLGLPSLFPRIFDPGPVDDLAELHAMLFSVQYASSQAWLDAGLRVAAVVGHSFGQLTALCVAGSMDLADGLRLVTGRARLMEKHWGADPGAMLAIEGDAERLDRLLESVSRAAAVDVACYNGPRNVVLAGDATAVDAVEQVCRAAPGLKTVRLANSHAYHSRLADPILDGLRALAGSITWRAPSIPVQTCSPGQTWVGIDADKIVQHTREPVYFGDAVQRITSQHPSCVWLEAGSTSPIISMVRRAFPPTRDSDHDILLSADLGRGNPWASLARATSSLWAAGSPANFWAFCGPQADQYRWLNLPPYQFAKTRHWIQWQPARSQAAIEAPPPPSGPPKLVRRTGDEGGEAFFAIDVSHEIFDLSVRGHAVAGQSLCPAGLYFELAIRAAKDLQAPGTNNRSKVPYVEQLHIVSPLGLKQEGALFVALTTGANQGAGDSSKWDFTFFSCPSDAGARPAPLSQRNAHARGTVALLGAESATSRLQFVGRLLRSSRYDQVASSPSASRLSGDVLYKVFGRVVNYASYYKGLRNAIAFDGEVVGDVIMPGGPAADRLASSVSDPLAIDNFLQLAGIHVNCLQAGGSDDVVSVCNTVGEVLWSEAFLESDGQGKPSELHDTRTWRLYSNMVAKDKNTVANDVFVLDVTTGAVVMTMLGAEFTQVPLASLRRVLSKLNENATVTTAPSHTSSTLPAANSIFTNADKTLGPQDLLLNETTQHHNHAINNPLTSSKPDVAVAVAAPTNTTAAATDGNAELVQKMFSEVLGMPVEEVQPDSSLADLGVDSLMIIEVSDEVRKRFNVTLSMDDLQYLTDVQSLTQRLGGSSLSSAPAPAPAAAPSTPAPTTAPPGSETRNEPATLNGMAHTDGVINGENEQNEEDAGGVAAVGSDWLATSRSTFDADVQESGFAHFHESVYPEQAQLVIAYTVEALAGMGSDLRTLRSGERLPDLVYLLKHGKLIAQMYRILEDAGLVMTRGPDTTRTDQPIALASAQQLHEAIVQKFPQHAGEHRLLRATGARLADCLTGRVEPLSLIFGDAKARGLMEDVYTNGPMFQAATSFLSRFLVNVCESFRGRREIRILELGAGTGGTTDHLVNQLEKSAAGQKIRYTFSDISGSLVAAARKKFARYPFMDYAIINIEKDPVANLRGRYDVIISTNCIHATPSLVRSCTNIRHLLRKDGMLCLVEHTQNLFWFDLVWGLVEGWWLFDDGRSHALASETRWRESLQASGFPWVDWSDGTSDEAKTLRVIVASPSSQASSPAINSLSRDELESGLETQETVVFKHAGSLPLHADIYYPPTLQTTSEARAVALMIHGGGHVMLSRKDMRPKQTQMLLDVGFVPVSVDYRLCPETNLLEGPMTDVRDALSWARNTLPSLTRKRADIRIAGNRVVAVGWSTGGQLALSLGWTAPLVGLQPPQAILTFYCPTDYEDECWSRQNKPFGDAAMTGDAYDLWDAVADSPIVAYNPPPATRAAGGWMAKNDARSRIVLHMNWYGQTVPLLVHGLKDKTQRNGARNEAPRLAMPTLAQIQAISPLAQIRQGSYRTPTFMVHPVGDDLIPWQQARRTADEMLRKGIETDLRIIENAIHLFDMYPRYDKNTDAVRAIADGYAFLSHYV